MQDLKLQEFKTQTTNKNKPCATIQPFMVGKKHESCKPLPGKFLVVQDTGKLSELADTGLPIDSQVGINSHKVLLSKTTPVCQKNSNPSFGVKLRKVQVGPT